MANRRMLSKTVTASDAYTDLSFEAQALYVQLTMEADDDGFLNSAKKIMRSIGVTQDSYDELIHRGFVICFDSGVIVLTHWNINNHVQKDRYTETVYQEEKKMLWNAPNGEYVLQVESDQQQESMYPNCIQNVSETDTQVSTGKIRLDEDRRGKGRSGEESSRVRKGEIQKRGFGGNQEGKTHVITSEDDTDEKTMGYDSENSVVSDSEDLYIDFCQYGNHKGIDFDTLAKLFDDLNSRGKVTADNYMDIIDCAVKDYRGNGNV